MAERLKHGALVECVDVAGSEAAQREFQVGARYRVWRPMHWAFEGKRQHARGIRVSRVGARALVGGRKQHWNPTRFRLVPVEAGR
jgi:hypothetical protein